MYEYMSSFDIYMYEYMSSFDIYMYEYMRGVIQFPKRRWQRR